ncbi:MAG: ORF6N domain-containing protein [Elusimicrobiota bacterium]
MTLIISAAQIAELIYFIRGRKVMLDSDLARLYGVEVRQLKRQVRRNITRFPPDFMFELTKTESDALWCQIGTLKSRGAHAKYPPFVFTEQGVAMLSSVLNSPQAIQVNITIIRVFVELREVLTANKHLARRLAKIEHRLGGHDVKLGEIAKEIRAVFESIRQLMSIPEKPRKRIGFQPRHEPDRT